MSVRKRSSAPKVLGILNLIGGFLGLLGALYTVLVLVVGPGGFGPPNAGNNPFDPVLMDAYMVANAPGYHASQYAGTSVELILDVLLIVSGFGLLNYKEWARKLAIAYAITSLVFKAVSLGYQVFVMLPAMSAFFDQALSNAPPALQGMGGFMKFGLYFGLSIALVVAVYPIVVLCLLLSKKGKAAFQPMPAEAYDDEDDYDDRRERFDDRPRRDDDRYGERDDRGGR